MPLTYRAPTRALPALRNASVSTKLLYTSFLIVVGIGLIAALSYLYLTHAGLDGKPGLDVNDIVISYYGNRSGTALESAIRGPMSPHIKVLERDIVAAWLTSGASRTGYEALVKPILKKDCMACHSAAASASLKTPNLSTFSDLQKFTVINTGKSLLSLVELSHIHLFGISLLLITVGLIFVRAELWPWLHYVLIVLPFAAMLADIFSWFLTKFYPLYAYVVVIGGALMVSSIGAQILISLYQLWFMPREREG